MKQYDPYKSPDPVEWLDAEETDRIERVQRYHRKAGIALPNERIHAAVHVIVENQIAMGDEIPVRGTLMRLMSEGLDRHDAMHAIGSVLTNLIYAAPADGDPADSEAAYFDGLSSLTAQAWLKESEQGS